MATFGCLVLVKTVYNYMQGIPPEAITMGVIGGLALVANVVAAVILYRFRDGDSNMKSVWLCSRNDAIGNIAVIIAAIGVFGTGSLLPDLFVALIMSVLGLTGGYHGNIDLVLPWLPIGYIFKSLGVIGYGLVCLFFLLIPQLQFAKAKDKEAYYRGEVQAD